jgi:signal transduction histidine kinase/DNA-binding response OmpR family regulator
MSSTQADSSRVNILLVDDDQSNLVALETILQAEDRNLLRASSGDEALHHLLHHEVAVVLLDVRMPGISGLETAGLIRGRKKTKDVPIIFLTAYDSLDKKDLTTGYSLGAVDYLVKPIDPDALKAKVAVFVELYKKTEQVRQQAALLHEKNIQLENANFQRLGKLVELGGRMTAERNPAKLLQTFCDSARDILGAHYSRVRMFGADGESSLETVESRQSAGAAGAGGSNENQLIGRLSLTNSIVRSRTVSCGAGGIEAASRETSVLAVPVLSGERVLGWTYWVNKIGAEEFSEADERLAQTLASQLAVAYENAILHTTAEAANRMKDEFLAVLSHELRTPLNAMLGWAGLLRDGRLDPGQQKQAFETIVRNGKMLNRMVEDILDASRMITGKLRLELSLFDLSYVIRAAAEALEPAAFAKQLSVELLMPRADLLMTGDSTRLQQVVSNLLSNAIKFTPKHGRITVVLSHEDNQVQLAVTDSGQGIAREFLPFVFDRFRQADSSTTRANGGLGLGLALVRHLIELHGGTISADSKGRDQGSTFVVTLPLGQNDHDSPGDRTPGSKDLQPLGPSGGSLAGVKILVVEDHEDTSELLASIVHQQGAEVRRSSSVDEALEVLSRWRPDVILSDIGMPEWDGYQFIEKLRRLPADRGGAIPAAAITSYATEEDRRRALAMGYQLHVAKPVKPDDIIDAVSRLSGRTTA